MSKPTSRYCISNFPPLLSCGEGESRFPKLKDKAPLVASSQEERNKDVAQDVFSTSSNKKTYRDACVSSGNSFRPQTELSGTTDIKNESNKRCVSIRKLNHIEHRPKPHRCGNKIRDIKSTELSSSKNQRRTLASCSHNTVPSIAKAKSSLKGANSIYTTTNGNKFGVHKVLPSIPKHEKKEETSASDNHADEKKSTNGAMKHNKDIKPKSLDQKKNGQNAAIKVKKQAKKEKSNVSEPLQTKKSESCRNSVEKIRSNNADCSQRDAPNSVSKSSSGKTGAKNISGPKASNNEIVSDSRRSKGLIDSNSDSVSSKLSATKREDENENRTRSSTTRSDKKSISRKSSVTIKRSPEQSDGDVVGGHITSQKKCVVRKSSPATAPHATKESIPSKSRTKSGRKDMHNDGCINNVKECICSKSNSVSSVLSVASRGYDRSDSVSPHSARKVMASKSRASIRSCHKGSDCDIVDGDRCSVKRCTDSKPSSVMSVLSVTSRRYDRSGSITPRSARDSMPSKSSARIRNTRSRKESDSASVNGNKTSLIECVESTNGTVTYVLSTQSISPQSARESITSKSSAIVGNSCEEPDSDSVDLYVSNVKECVDNISVTSVLSAHTGTYDYSGSVSPHSARESISRKSSSRIRNRPEDSDIVDGDIISLKKCVDSRSSSVTDVLSTTSNRYDCRDSVSPDSARESIPSTSSARIRRSCEELDSGIVGVDKNSVKECISNSSSVLSAPPSRHDSNGCSGSVTPHSAREYIQRKSSARIRRSYKDPDSDVCVDKISEKECVGSKRSSTTSVLSRIPRYDGSGSVTPCSARDSNPSTSSTRIGRSGGESYNDLIKGDKHRVQGCIDKKSSSATSVSSRIPRYDHSGSVTPRSARKSSARIGRSGGETSNELIKGDKHVVKLCIDKKSSSATTVLSRIPRYDRSGSVTPRSVRESTPINSSAKIGRSGGESNIDHIDGNKYRFKECIDNKSSSATSVLSGTPRRCQRNGSITPRSARESVSSKMARIGRNREDSESDIVDGHIMRNSSSVTSILQERKRKDVRKLCSRTSNASIRNSCTTSESNLVVEGRRSMNKGLTNNKSHSVTSVVSVAKRRNDSSCSNTSVYSLYN